MNSTPLWDVTYRGLPLGEAAWRAHLEILRAYVEGRTPAESDDIAHHEATVALQADGRILYCRTCLLGVGTTSAFHWCQYRLTEYGRAYAAQRLAAR